MTDDGSRLVYSTDKTVTRKDKPGVKKPQVLVPPSLQKVSVSLDRKGRGGKSVTLIKGLQMSAADKEVMLKQLKTMLGTGGTLKRGMFEVQGDHRDAILELLQGKGYKVKRAGG